MEHSKEDPIYVFPERRLRAASLPVFIFMSLWAIYVFPQSFILSAAKYEDRSHVNRSQKHGVPCSFISGNICFEFSVPCLCIELTALALLSLPEDISMAPLATSGTPKPPWRPWLPKVPESIGTPCSLYTVGPLDTPGPTVLQGNLLVWQFPAKDLTIIPFPSHCSLCRRGIFHGSVGTGKAIIAKWTASSIIYRFLLEYLDVSFTLVSVLTISITNMGALVRVH